MEAIHQGSFALNQETSEYFEKSGHTQFITKVFQAIAIVWPEIPDNDHPEFSELNDLVFSEKIKGRIQKLESKWKNREKGITYSDLASLLPDFRSDVINYYAGLQQLEGFSPTNEFSIFAEDIDSPAIDRLFLTFLDDELGRIGFYREYEEDRPKAIFNRWNADYVGNFSVTWKADGYFDYALLCYHLFNLGEDGNGDLSVEEIRTAGTTKFEQHSSLRNQITVSLILVDILEKEGLFLTGQGPTDKFIRAFAKDSEEMFFKKFDANPDIEAVIPIPGLEYLVNELQAEYSNLIDKLFYTLVHFIVPRAKNLSSDFFVQLFKFDLRLAHFDSQYLLSPDPDTQELNSLGEKVMGDLKEGGLLLHGIIDYRVITGEEEDHDNRIEALKEHESRSFCEWLKKLKVFSTQVPVYGIPNDDQTVFKHLPHQSFHIVGHVRCSPRVVLD